MPAGFERVATLESEVQARLLGAALLDRGVPHVIVSHHSSAFDGVFQTHSGWGHVEAPPSARDEVLATIEDLEGGWSGASEDGGSGSEAEQ